MLTRETVNDALKPDKMKVDLALPVDHVLLEVEVWRLMYHLRLIYTVIQMLLEIMKAKL